MTIKIKAQIINSVSPPQAIGELNCRLYDIFILDTTNITEFVFKKFQLSQEVMLLLQNGEMPSFSWPVAVTWPNGIEPVWTSNGLDVVWITKINNSFFVARSELNYPQ